MQMASNANNDLARDEYQALQLALQDSLGVVVGDEGRDMIAGTLQPLMAREHLSGLSELATALRNDTPASIRTEVLEAITAHNTRWFGYPEIYHLLSNYVLPSIMQQGRNECRIWLVGCGQGQSAYSLALAVDDYLLQISGEITVEIVATDSSAQAIAKAESGSYDDIEIQQLSQAKLQRYFDLRESENGTCWQVNDKISSMVQFKSIDLLQDTLSQGHFDIIICPDTLMYFSVASKSRLLDEFASLLEPSGILIANHNEPVQPFCDRFDRVDHEAGRFYRQVC